MSLSNYPDGMDFGAYDDYHDPMLECGHRSQSECDCWCDGGHGDSAHQNEYCTVDNCAHLQCQSCGSPCDEEGDDVVHHVKNLQRKNSKGEPAYITTPTIPLRWIPQNKLLEARLCDHCKDEYDESLANGELIEEETVQLREALITMHKECKNFKDLGKMLHHFMLKEEMIE